MDAAPAGATPDQVDPTTLGRADESADMFVEAIAAWDLEPTPGLDVEVADPADETPASPPAGSRVEPHPYADAGVDNPALLGDSARADVYGDRAALGGGDLYGVHVTAAGDRELPDDDLAQNEGESWLEHLEVSATEVGPEPEHMIDINEDTDPHSGHHRTATSDTPVADLGSGGPRGL